MRATLLLAGVAGTMSSLASAKAFQKTRNLIFVVPDGFGYASQTLVRDYSNIIRGVGSVGRPNSTEMGVDSMLLGSVRTCSSDNLITDSAAGATAFATGRKTYNGAIGIDDGIKPVASILEAAHLEGFKTGIVATSRVTHATPACYCAHVIERKLENEIAGHQIGHSHPLGSVVDLIMGGGRRHYLPRKLNGWRTDNDLVTWAKSQGFNYAANKNDLDGHTKGLGKVPLPFLGLFADSHMAYEMDRDQLREPSLMEMTEVAVKSLTEATTKRDKGYFLMIEASRIDHAAHANDIAAHANEAIVYNKVMSYLQDYVTSHPDTQVVSAADHESGGLTLKKGYNPVVLERANHSTEFLQRVFQNYTGTDRAAYLKSTLLPQYGFLNASGDDIERYLGIFDRENVSKMGRAIVHDFAKEVGVQWSTDSHSAVDVALYGFAVGKAYAQMKEQLGAQVDNTQLAKYAEKTLGLDLDQATDILRENWAKYEASMGHGCQEGHNKECGDSST